MEDPRFIKWIILGVLLFAAHFFVFAYDDKTTHPALTDEIVDLFNLYYPKLKISSEEKELIKKGSIEEDEASRWLRHFYDPVYNRGLWGVQISSKEWAEDTFAQAGFGRPLAGAVTGLFGASSDYSWERAIYDYVWEDRVRGLEALGHILHLVEDASVPDHTRNDGHPPILDLGSPYEYWTKKFTSENVEGLATAIYKSNVGSSVFNTLAEYFDSLAIYSNNNFFSEDTILAKDYSKPVIGRYVGEFGFSDDYPLARKIKKFDGTVEYTLIDNKRIILNAYWARLSKQAVLHGAGVVRLFFEEVEKERERRVLFAKNKSVFDKVAGAVLGVLGVNEEEPTSLVAEIGQDAFEPVVYSGTDSRVSPSQFLLESEPITVEIPSPNPNASPIPEVEISPQVQILSQENNSESLPSPSSSHSLISIPQAGFGGGALPPAIMAVGQEEGTGGTASPPPPPADTTGPNTLLEVLECSHSLSADGCLLATSTITLLWSSSVSDLDYYLLECEMSGSGCADFTISTTTATTTLYTLPSDDSTYTFRAKGVDISGNHGSIALKIIELSSRPVVINEIAWAGTKASPSDEWIELYNRTTKTISLEGSVLAAEDGVPYLALSGEISAKGFYLIERTDDNTVSDIPADLALPFSGLGAGSGLSNSGEVLVLTHASTTIDKTPSSCPTWCAGHAGSRASMERVDPDISGEVSTSWGTHDELLANIKNGKDASGDAIAGTPKARNSHNYLIITPSCCVLSGSKTIKKEDSPYIIPSPIEIPAGLTLTLEPGVVVKISDASVFPIVRIRGRLVAAGTTENPIIFTSIHDDAYGGDTNRNGTSTLPAAGDWKTILVDSASEDSLFRHTIFRYGGGVTGGFGPPPEGANSLLAVLSSEADIKDSTFEHSAASGLVLKSAGGEVRDSLFRKNGAISGDFYGVIVSKGAVEILNNRLEENAAGLSVSDGPHRVEGNTFVKNIGRAVYFGSGDPAGTPRFSGNSASENGLNGIEGTTNVNDYVFEKDLPYVYQGSLILLAAGKTASIKPGVIFKFKDFHGTIAGTIKAEGTMAEPIVFTSLLDDEYGGDTNNDATSTSPLPGDWFSLALTSPVGTSTLKHTVIRYGGACLLCGAFPFGAVKAEGSLLDISEATIEKNKSIGLWLSSSASASIRDAQVRENGMGILIEDSTLALSGILFQKNDIGLAAGGSYFVKSEGGISFESNTTNAIPPGLIP